MIPLIKTLPLIAALVLAPAIGVAAEPKPAPAPAAKSASAPPHHRTHHRHHTHRSHRGRHADTGCPMHDHMTQGGASGGDHAHCTADHHDMHGAQGMHDMHHGGPGDQKPPTEGAPAPTPK